MLSRKTTEKGMTAVIAFVTMLTGVISHYASDWSGMTVKYGGYTRKVALYRLCDNWQYREKCPDIAMERFFVTIVILSFVGSTLCLTLSMKGQREQTQNQKQINYAIMTIYMALAVLLLIASIVYIISAELIRKLHPGATLQYAGDNIFIPAKELRELKLVSAILAIFQCILFVTVAVRG